MEPLQIGAAITGLAAAVSNLRQRLAPCVDRSSDRQSTMCDLYSKLGDMTEPLLALKGLLGEAEFVPDERTDRIQVDHIIAVLTEGVLLFSLLQDFIVPTPPSQSSSSENPDPHSLLSGQSRGIIPGQLMARLCAYKRCAWLIATTLNM